MDMPPKLKNVTPMIEGRSNPIKKQWSREKQEKMAPPSVALFCLLTFLQ